MPRQHLTPGTHCTVGWVGFRAGLDRCGKPRLHRDQIPGPSSPQAVAIPTTLPCPLYIYMFIYLRTNSDLCHLHHKLVGFYNRDEKCLQRGTDWVFKQSGLRFVFKGLIVVQIHKTLFINVKTSGSSVTAVFVTDICKEIHSILICKFMAEICF